MAIMSTTMYSVHWRGTLHYSMDEYQNVGQILSSAACDKTPLNLPHTQQQQVCLPRSVSRCFMSNAVTNCASAARSTKCEDGRAVCCYMRHAAACLTTRLTTLTDQIPEKWGMMTYLLLRR